MPFWVGDLCFQCIAPETAEEWSQQNGLQFFEVSSMPPGRDVDAPFNYIAAKWYRAYEDKVEALASVV